ncbi:WxL domain-containing protein [Schleiferilactobacillus harbinensis]|uniref:WxL domain-containing protein n=1 Tax=Schleiferilactobacillus harbinensis TaxID=304207 RepID=A0A5P8M3H6_9LACO|nr:hypothetical protein [Schleiferilactobacillus harbinensis]QFR22825.1 hypothetical protein D1010_04860 [Schleiferilactobacillus harbinensis]
MNIIKGHRTTRGVFMLLLAALMSGALFVGRGSPPAKAATIGDELNNSALIRGYYNTVPTVMTANNTPWSMYEIPGLGRNRGPDEGSFVRTGYNDWSSKTMPLATDISAGGQASVKQTTTDWNGKVTASPIAVSFKNTGTDAGKPYFSLNYVTRADLVDFGNTNNAPTIAQAWAGQTTNKLSAGDRSNIFNPTGVSSKMKSSNGEITGKPVLDTAANQTFDGGFLQATGNVPISAAIAGSPSVVDAMMAGNWAVMVRVQVADGIDAKALAASIDWAKSYYYLTVQSIKILLFSVTVNFPMQFDHHVYMDPQNKQNFYLKVKGVPFWAKQTGTSPDSSNSKVQLQLQDGDADYVDYLNNRQITASTNTALTLDNLVGSDGNDGPQKDLNNEALQTPDLNGAKQPKFVDKAHVGVGNPLWNIWDVGGTWPFGPKSPLYQAGPTGTMITLLNAAGGKQIKERDMGDGIVGLYQAITQWFTTNMFKGNAHINFSFDVSKYQAGISKDQQALTAGRFFAAPKADGTFNSASGLAETDAVKISMYDSSQLVDPYSLTEGLDRADTNTSSLLRQTLHTDKSSQMNATKGGPAGMTPADYAVIRADQKDNGLAYPTYTNFTSWTGAIVPYDRMHWADTAGAAESTTFTDTLHSQGRFGTDLHYRTATPDPAQHGVLVNDGAAFSIAQRAAFLTDYLQNYAPIFDSVNPAKLTTGGVIKPQRYANVYSLYQYDATGKGTLPADNEPIANYTTTGNALSLKVSADTNAALNSKFITSSLDKKSWRYTGTMNTLPLAEATIKLTQPLNPQITLNGQSPYVVTDTQLAGAGVTKALGTWRDPLGIAAQDNLQTSLATPAVKQTANWNSISVLDTRTHALAVNVAKNTTAASVTPGLGGDSLAATLNYQMPTPTDQSNRVYYGEINLTRQATVPLKQDYLLDAKADFNKASANYLIFRNADAPDTAQYQVKKYFNTTGQPTTHRVSTVDINQDVPVKAEAAMLAAGPVNTSKTLTIWIPKVAGTTIAKVPVVTASDGTVATVTDTTTSQLASVQQAYYTYSAVFAKAPANFAYTYAYHVGASNVAASAYKQKLVDFVMTGTQILGQSNAIQFDLLRGVNLLTVPTLDFGKNPAPTAGAVYPLTAASKANAYFEIMENDGNTKKNTYTWFLSAVMNPFRTAANQTGYGTFSVALGSPTRDAAGAVPDSAPTDLWYANHQPNPMVANGTSSAQLYYVNPMVESDTAAADVSSIKRFYPNAQLTVPAGVTITPGQYQSTVIYTVNDNSGSL